jgi:hypothetical protein
MHPLRSDIANQYKNIGLYYNNKFNYYKINN